ncbi:hypothetical protein SELR_23530 [Selenomonas ruminantium subsp. lactilytica TAM6421]|uniref:Haloacid dehalogenase-like hydrolase n=1 Tax=Selenomonas ruminantium subsp. lactilytica (strain NBRC 103574 / TAM6421) TaxID=927704 RepID=I0GTH4_SELRL|nr:hypothetical protein [Selenomonas ruminantium]BAL84061.1 hypothetical protein SELR_23530 [Selenomonas ruminantium subsp. lactilytica TAM6421]
MLNKDTLLRIGCFLREQTGKVAVYGLKLNAQAVYWHFPKSIACFLDRDINSGFFCGLPIRRIEDLPRNNIHAIVIAASLSAESHIYARICDFCDSHGIVIYSLYSGKLKAECLGKAFPAEENQESELRKAIASHDIVSFDIFDTLLMRKVLFPTDVFDIVEKRLREHGIDIPGFKNYRIQAERGDKRHKGLAGIYLTLAEMLGWTDSQAALVMREELAAERQVLVPRPGMGEILSYAHDIGKYVLLVSDMYLQPEFLQEVLAENQLTAYDELYVSDDRGTGKGEQLFELVRKEHPAETYLHIGDNAIMDGWSARVHGFDSWLVPSALQILKTTEAANILSFAENFNDRLLIGLFANRTFGNPFAVREKLVSVKSLPQFASFFLAPLAAQYVLWLLQRAKIHHFEGVLFAARDGWLFNRLYQAAAEIMKLPNVPPGMYFYGSRKLCISAALQEEKALEWLKGHLVGQTHHFLRECFGFLPGDGHIPPAWGEDTDLIWNEVVDKKESIFARSAVIKDGYERYVARLGLKREGRYAFADLCSQGTTQCALTHSVLPNLYGLFFARYMSGSSVTMGRVETFLPQADWHMLANNALEFIFSSPEPSAASVDENGNIIFEEEDRSDKELKLLDEAQEAIEKFCHEFFSLCESDGFISPAIGHFLLSMYQQPIFAGAGKVFDGMDINDNLMGVRVDCLLTNEK